MNSKQPRTVKDALMLEVFGDLDRITEKLEQSYIDLNTANTLLESNHKALTLAAEQYKTVVNQFTDESKKELTRFIQLKADDATKQIELKIKNEILTTLKSNRPAALPPINTILIAVLSISLVINAYLLIT